MDIGLDGLIIEWGALLARLRLSDSAQQVTPDALVSISAICDPRADHHSPKASTNCAPRSTNSTISCWRFWSAGCSVSRDIGQYKKEHDMPILQAQRYGGAGQLACRAAQAVELGMTASHVHGAAGHEESVRQQMEVLASSFTEGHGAPSR